MDDSDNYLGISLLSCLRETFHFYFKSSYIVNYIDCVGLIGDEKRFFFYKLSLNFWSYLWFTYKVIEYYLSKRKRIYCAIIDYLKAFLYN